MSEQNSLKELILKARQVNQTMKRAFVPYQKEAGAMPPPPGMPMDPAMMGGAMPPPPPPGMPMDPAMMGGAMPPPPPPGGDPMAEGMPSDPNMPPPPEGGAPAGGAPNPELMQIVNQMAEGMDKIESKQEALETRFHETLSQFDEMRGKIDMLIQILEGKKSGI